VTRAAEVDPSYAYMQKSFTAMDTKPKTNPTFTMAIPEEVRKGQNLSALYVKKIDTEVTYKGSTRMGTAVNGTRDGRLSIDRVTLQDQTTAASPVQTVPSSSETWPPGPNARWATRSRNSSTNGATRRSLGVSRLI
jgi:hypothetical protein